jgi:transposase
LFEYLPVDHPVFVYADIFTQLDTRKIEATYSPLGQHGYDPRMLMGLLIYSYAHGVFSSREIASRCRTDLGFMYISWCLNPDHRTISDFRKNNIDSFKDLFKQSVGLARQLGMMNLGHVSLDGSKFKANTSKHKAMSYGYMQKREKELLAEIEEYLRKSKEVDEAEDSYLGTQSGEEIAEELQIRQQRLEKIQKAKKELEQREAQENPGVEIDEKKQISFADPEARIMGKKGNFDYRYNGQISVESSHQLIVGQHVSLAVNDQKEVSPALEEIKENTGEFPDKMSLDHGYFSGENLEKLQQKQIDGYVATGREGKKKNEESVGQFGKELFVYQQNLDQFVCPNGKTLKLKSSNADGIKIYQAKPEACAQCPFQPRCTTSSQGRSLRTDAKEPLREQMREKMKTEAAIEIYRQRKVIVEPVFGVIKTVIYFQAFSLRGIQKVSGEFSLVCASYNFKKMVSVLGKGKLRPDFLKQRNLTSNWFENQESQPFFMVFFKFGGFRIFLLCVINPFSETFYYYIFSFLFLFKSYSRTAS